MSQKPKKYYGKGGLSGLGGIMNKAEQLGHNVNRNLAYQRQYAPQPTQYHAQPQQAQRTHPIRQNYQGYQPQPPVRLQPVPQYVIFNIAVRNMF
jgi:hypothetical protein